MITLNNVTLRRGSSELLEKINWTIYHKQRIGLIGANGCGKSSLFALLQQQLHPDNGEMLIPAQLRIAHVAQETPALDIAAIDYVKEGDAELAILQKKLNAAEANQDGARIAELHLQLNDIDGYTATARAAQLLVGLGFDHHSQAKSVKEFSGGWRVRLNLARALMARSDMLLLDEPTNHLDLDAVIWLESWLQQYHGTLILISHDREFLDATVNHIALIKHKALKVFTGNYSTYEKTYAQQLQLQHASYDKQQKKIKHLMSFVNRFKAKATKAKQAQSRLKAIERMDIVCAVQAESPFEFEFKKPDECPYPMLQLQQARVQYGDHVVLDRVNLSLVPKDRIGVLGPNGAGKSSLIKVLAGELALAQGERIASSGLHIGYFAQHQVDHLDLADTALGHLANIAPDLAEVDLRKYLGGFGFSDETTKKPVSQFSGGEKSRLALALIVYQKPNLLLLDEPTNHLDMEMRHALSLALQDYEGAVILVSHDRFLLRSTVDQMYLIANQEVAPFAGDLDDYQKWLIEYRKQQLADTPDVPAGLTRKEQRRLDAESRARKRPLLLKIDRIEKRLGVLQDELTLLESNLADNSLYAADNKQRLQTCILRQAELKQEIISLEADWLHAHELLGDAL